MPTQLQFRRGTTTQNNSFTGAAGEISVDTTIDTLRLHDGATAGGFTLARGEASTAAATNVNCTANNSTNETVYVTFVDGATGSQGIETDTNLTYNPSTNTRSTLATSAKYADLAERYTSDSMYSAGTVVVFGGDAEVTESAQRMSKRIAGIVSTDPAYLMNSALENSVAVGLMGRVPCKVVGEITKGDRMVSSATPGHAEAWHEEGDPPMGSVIGKSLENKTGTGEGVVEVVVGRI